MITLIEGLTGAGKTWLMTRIVREDWKLGLPIFPNFPLWYDEESSGITRWHNLDETYALRKGVLVIDESQKVMDARRWQSLPMIFTEKIAMSRHHGLDIITTTQDIGHIDKRIRTNVHVRYHCQSIFRFPKNEKVKPLLQMIRVIKRTRIFNNDQDKLLWRVIGTPKIYFISKYWTKTYYNTYGEVGQEKFLCNITFQKKQNEKMGLWKAKLYSREMVDRGKARL